MIIRNIEAPCSPDKSGQGMRLLLKFNKNIVNSVKNTSVASQKFL
jgi:hypothetical protein